jgi:hypothetical protein
MLPRIGRGRSMEYSSEAAPRFGQELGDRLHASIRDHHLPSWVLPATKVDTG